MKASEQVVKITILSLIVLFYVVLASTLLTLINTGNIDRAQPPENTTQEYTSDISPPPPPLHVTQRLDAAILYVEEELTMPNGHINTYKPLQGQTIQGANDTNSEAISYSLQIAAQAKDQERFDRQLKFLEEHMQHPKGYLMWRLDEDDIARGEGRNNAPDADLRAIRALYIAHDQWREQRYLDAIDEITDGLELIAITDDNRIAAYAGLSGDEPWRAKESYLSYTDFQTIDRLANNRRGVWEDVAQNMRTITLDAQIHNGLYNSEYWPQSGYGNALDGSMYSINSLWIMVRFAESGDHQLMDSARESLQFYKDYYEKNGIIYSAYTSSGEPATDYETVWAYALIARAAHALGDEHFTNIMTAKMLEYQVFDEDDSEHGAFIEGTQNDTRVGQFTMQETILSLQEVVGDAPRFI